MRLASPIGRALLAFSAAFAFHVNHAIAEPASVYFKSPLDNQVVQSPVRLVFGLNGKRIGPVGDLNPNLGHHHLIINGDSIPLGRTYQLMHNICTLARVRQRPHCA